MKTGKTAMREIHFFESMPDLHDHLPALMEYLAEPGQWDPNLSTAVDYASAEEWLYTEKAGTLYTTQVSFLNEAWQSHCEDGDRVFIHDDTGEYEVTEDCPRTTRKLTSSSDIFKLWRAGEFATQKEINN